MGMDPVQWVFLGLQLLQSAAQIGIITWLLSGGWKFVLRTFGFSIDTLLVSFIGRIYEYFMQILNGTLFNDAVLEELMRNVYIFIGIIMFFRLMMIVIKYLVNPDLVNDAKIGTNALIQRCVLGLAGILFIPTLFDLALNLQAHILEDNLIQQIIIPQDMLAEVKDKVDQGGKYIGTYVLSGFISPGENASSKTKTEYKNWLDTGGESGLSTLKKDGWLVGEYEYDYFYFLSTFCLCYVLYIMIKYTLDILTRFFRMLMYQMIAPIAMIEYMINGADDGVFKTWKSGILGTYFMLFVRVMALWFVVFVMALMSSDGDYVAGSLLATDDYLLRALILIALIGFMMDLPKLMGQVFGLDLEQEGNAGGILKQVGGMLKGAAVGALTFGGAAVGGAVGVGKAALGATKLGKNYDQLKKDVAQRAPGLSGLAASGKSAFGGMLGAAMKSNSFTGAAYNGYQGQKQEQEKASKESSDLSKANENKRKAEIHDELEQKQNAAYKTDDTVFDPVLNRNIASDAHVQASVNDTPISVTIDPKSLAGLAGAMAATQQVNNQPGQQTTQGVTQQSGTTTVTLDNIDVNVTGKATANYEGGLETNITGKATTTYNDGLEVDVGGQAVAKYDKGLEVNVDGPATATYSKGMDVQVDGPATAKYSKGLDVEIDGPATAKFDKNLDVEVSGNATATFKGDVDTLIEGNATAIYEGQVDTLVQGNATAVYEGDVDTLVQGNTTGIIEGNVDINISKNKNDN